MSVHGKVLVGGLQGGLCEKRSGAAQRCACPAPAGSTTERKGERGTPRLEEEVLCDGQVHPQRDLQPVEKGKSARRKEQQRTTATA